jgi:hypothetical protein
MAETVFTENREAIGVNPPVSGRLSLFDCIDCNERFPADEIDVGATDEAANSQMLIRLVNEARAILEEEEGG